MTDIALIEAKAQQALSLFQSLGLRAGSAVSPRRLIIVCASEGWDGLEIADGLEHGVGLGWFEDNGMIRLTSLGYSQFADA